jgi:hypothetical protein
MSIESRIKEYSARLECLAERLRSEDFSNVDIYRNFLNFVSANPEHTYYPITKLLTAAKCKNANEALDVANYFSLGRKPLLMVTFCYFDFDGTDIKIDREYFIDSLSNDIPPIEDETGYPIQNFEPSRLGFYCNLVSE